MIPKMLKNKRLAHGAEEKIVVVLARVPGTPNEAARFTVDKKERLNVFQVVVAKLNSLELLVANVAGIFFYVYPKKNVTTNSLNLAN